MANRVSDSGEDTVEYDTDVEIQRRYRRRRSLGPKNRCCPERAEDIEDPTQSTCDPGGTAEHNKPGRSPTHNKKAIYRRYDDDENDDYSEEEHVCSGKNTYTSDYEHNKRRKYQRRDSPHEGHSRVDPNLRTRRRSPLVKRKTCSCHYHDTCDYRKRDKVHLDGRRYRSRARSTDRRSPFREERTQHHMIESQDDSFSDKVRHLFKIIKATHHFHNANSFDPPIAIRNTTNALMSCIKPAFTTDEVSLELERNSRQWQDNTLKTLRTHYSNIIEKEIHTLADFPDLSWQGPLEIATSWARRNLGRRLKPSTLRDVKQRLHFFIDMVCHTPESNILAPDNSRSTVAANVEISTEQKDENKYLQPEDEEDTDRPVKEEGHRFSWMERIPENSCSTITISTPPSPSFTDTQDFPPLSKPATTQKHSKRPRFSKFRNSSSESKTKSPSPHCRPLSPPANQVNQTPVVVDSDSSLSQ